MGSHSLTGHQQQHWCEPSTGRQARGHQGASDIRYWLRSQPGISSGIVAQYSQSQQHAAKQRESQHQHGPGHHRHLLRHGQRQGGDHQAVEGVAVQLLCDGSFGEFWRLRYTNSVFVLWFAFLDNSLHHLLNHKGNERINIKTWFFIKIVLVLMNCRDIVTVNNNWEIQYNLSL